ncbi:hypothetical protein AB0K51_25315 [Kitasatospora sp. NPDC049285]|uniref:hypothetical protein n=1 Tax=Kitasatospora sp. NPDC049285 TaxID=3157096 RepID=UPI0034468A0E
MAAPFAEWDGQLTVSGIQLLGAELDGRPVVVRSSPAPGRDVAVYNAVDGTVLREFGTGEGSGGLRRSHVDAAVLVTLDLFRGLRGTVTQYDLRTGEEVHPATWGERRTLWGRPPRMTAVASFRGADGRRALLAGWSDGLVQQLDPATGEQTGAKLRGTGKAQVWSLAVYTAADGTLRLACGDAEGVLRRWNPATGNPVGEPVRAHRAEIQHLVAYQAQGRTVLATGSGDHSVRIWDPESGTQLGRPMVQLGNTLGLCAYQVGEQAALAVASDRLYRYDGATGEPLGEPVGEPDDDACLAVCAVESGERVLLFTAEERGLRRYDGASGTPR